MTVECDSSAPTKQHTYAQHLPSLKTEDAVIKKNNQDESKERKKNHLYICVCVDRNEYLQTSFCFCFNKNVRMDIIIQTKPNETKQIDTF